MQKVHSAVRLEAADLARVDALAPLLGTAVSPAKRSDVLRALILAALPEFEREHGGKGAEKGRAGK